jgi:hypothetical protein
VRELHIVARRTLRVQAVYRVARILQAVHGENGA